MSAWTVLIGNSTVPNNSIAWLHLNNQNQGTGNGDGNTFYQETLCSLEGDLYVIIEETPSEILTLLEPDVSIYLEEGDINILPNTLYVDL